MDIKKLNKDEILKLVNESISWITTHWQTFLTSAGIAVLFIALGIYFIVHYNTVKQQSKDRISMAQALIYQGRSDQGIQILDDIISKYPDSSTGQFARLTKADSLYYLQNYSGAGEVYQQIIDNKNNKVILPFAHSGLGYVRENQGNYAQAISIYSDFISKFPEHFLAPRIYESLARAYELNGSTDLAKQTYEKLATSYPNSIWTQKAQYKLSILSGKPVEPPVKYMPQEKKDEKNNKKTSTSVSSSTISGQNEQKTKKEISVSTH